MGFGDGIDWSLVVSFVIKSERNSGWTRYECLFIYFIQIWVG